MYKKIVVSLSLLAIAPAFGSEITRARTLFAAVTELNNSPTLRFTAAQELRKNALFTFLEEKEQATFNQVASELGIKEALQEKKDTPAPAQTSSFYRANRNK